MSAAAAREELEAALRRAATWNGRCRVEGKCPLCEQNITLALGVADEYAQAVADERVAGHVTRVTSETAARLTAAHAEAHRKAAKR